MTELTRPPPAPITEGSNPSSACLRSVFGTGRNSTPAALADAQSAHQLPTPRLDGPAGWPYASAALDLPHLLAPPSRPIRPVKLHPALEHPHSQVQAPQPPHPDPAGSSLPPELNTVQHTVRPESRDKRPAVVMEPVQDLLCCVPFGEQAVGSVPKGIVHASNTAPSSPPSTPAPPGTAHRPRPPWRCPGPSSGPACLCDSPGRGGHKG